MKQLYYYIRQKITQRRPYTIRFTFTFLLALASILGTATIVSKEQAGIILVPTVQTTRVGETFTVEVLAEVYEPVNAVRVDILFNNSVLELLSINKSDSVLTLWTEEPYLDANKIIIEGGTYRRGFVGRHKITELEFRVLQAGEVLFEVDQSQFFAGDGTGRVVSAPLAETVQVVAREEGDFVDITPISKIDINGTVTLRDVSVFMADWRSRAVIHDFNNDGVMNFKDFSILLSRLL